MNTVMSEPRQATARDVPEREGGVEEAPTAQPETPIVKADQAAQMRLRLAAAYAILMGLLTLLALIGKAVVYDYQAVKIVSGALHHQRGPR